MTRTISPREFETLDLLARTTSAIRAFNTLLTSAIQEGENFSYVASGINILLSTQCDNLAVAEENLRILLKEARRETRGDDVDARALAKEMQVSPDLIERVIKELSTKPAPDGETAARQLG